MAEQDPNIPTEWEAFAETWAERLLAEHISDDDDARTFVRSLLADLRASTPPAAPAFSPEEREALTWVRDSLHANVPGRAVLDRLLASAAYHDPSHQTCDPTPRPCGKEECPCAEPAHDELEELGRRLTEGVRVLLDVVEGFARHLQEYDYSFGRPVHSGHAPMAACEALVIRIMKAACPNGLTIQATPDEAKEGR